MIFSQESRSRVQAQIAAFAHDSPITESTDAYMHLSQPESYFSEEYESFLKSIGSAALLAIEGRQEILESYPPFASDVSTLLESIQRQKVESGIASVRNRPDFLGAGGFAQVFSLESNGRSLAVRKTAMAPTFDYLIATALRARGVARAENLVAASYDEGVTISELVKGTPVHKLSTEELALVSTHHLEELVATATELGERRVTVDANAGNFIYEPDTGFTIIDFRPQNLRRVPPDVMTVNVTDMMQMFEGPDVQPNHLSERIESIFQTKLG